MTAIGRDARWETTTPLMHSNCNDGVIQLSPLSSYAMLEVYEISHAFFVHLPCSIPRTFKSGEFEATVEADWILAFLLFFLQKHFFNDVTINVIITCKYWWDFYNFSVTGNVRMIHANCEELPKFIKVTAKILSVPFFPDMVLYSS